MTDLGTYDVWPAELWGIPNPVFWILGVSDAGAIWVDIDDNNPLTITNYTQVTHIFNVGDVERTAYQVEGNWYVTTYGAGTNDGFGIIPGPVIDDFNEEVGPIAFQAIDLQLLAYTTVVETGQYIEAQVSGFLP